MTSLFERREATAGLSEAVLLQCLRAFPYVRLKVTGSCMLPAFSPGSTVLVGRTERHPPRMGDVVLVRHPAGLRLHRLVWGPPLALMESRWRTKADRSLTLDPWILPGAVLGKVVGVDGASGRGAGVLLRGMTRALVGGVLRTLSRRVHLIQERSRWNARGSR